MIITSNKNINKMNELLNKELIELSSGAEENITILSNASAHLFHFLNGVNWVGFYLTKNKDLILGPFQGKVACIKIPYGKGVCGTALKEERTILVKDVNQFEGHIACDPSSRSEIVIPIFKDNKVYGVLDIDSQIINRFTDNDKLMLESYVKTLEGLLK